MKRPDDASLIVIALSLVAFLVFLWIATTAPAKSATVRAWTPLPSQAFLPIPPLVRPIRPELIATAQPSPTHTPRVSPRTPRRIPSTSSSSGVATYQPLPGLYGSAGPVLRAAGVHVGQTVQVCARPEHEGFSSCVYVTIWPGGCWCKVRPGGPTLIDLSARAFAKLAPLGLGVIGVTVSW